MKPQRNRQRILNINSLANDENYKKCVKRSQNGLVTTSQALAHYDCLLILCTHTEHFSQRLSPFMTTFQFFWYRKLYSLVIKT